MFGDHQANRNPDKDITALRQTSLARSIYTHPTASCGAPDKLTELTPSKDDCTNAQIEEEV